MGADVNVMALQNAMKGPRKNAAILDQAFLAGEDLGVVPIHDIGQGAGKGSHRHTRPCSYANFKPALKSS